MSNDHAELVQLSHRYADAVRRYDADAWGATWADDAVWELGPGREVAGREAIVALWIKAMSSLGRVVQMYGSPAYVVDGDTASGRIQLLELIDVGDGSKRMMAGHYDDTFVRTADGWRFSGRVLTQYYRGTPDLLGDFVTPPTA